MSSQGRGEGDLADVTDKVDTEGTTPPRFFLCESATWYMRAAVGVSVTSLVLHVIAMASPNWISVTTGSDALAHAGLWTECAVHGIYTTDAAWICLTFAAAHHLDTMPVFLKAAQGLAICGVALITCSAFFSSLYTILPKLRGRDIASHIAFICVVLAGILLLCGTAVYASGYPRDQDDLGRLTFSLGWALGLDILAAILCFLASALILVDFRKSQLKAIWRIF